MKFKLNIHPAALSFYLKCDVASDSVSVTIILYKNSNPVDTGKWSGTNLANIYSRISFPITQHSVLVDSAAISILGSATPGHYFLIDYLHLDSTYTSAHDLIDDQLQEVFPNPSVGFFSIKSHLQIHAIEIASILGQRIYFAGISAIKSDIDLTSQPNGIYFLQITTDKGISRKKIVISR